MKEKAFVLLVWRDANNVACCIVVKNAIGSTGDRGRSGIDREIEARPEFRIDIREMALCRD